MTMTRAGARRRAGPPIRMPPSARGRIARAAGGRGQARPADQPGGAPAHDGRGQSGVLSLEAVLVLPVLAVLLVVLLQLAVLIADVLLVHEAARAGARAAATTSTTAPVEQAVREAAPELDGLRVTVTPAVRRDGDLARVEVTLRRTIGPVAHRLRATAVARVEPAVGTTAGEPP